MSSVMIPTDQDLDLSQDTIIEVNKPRINIWERTIGLSLDLSTFGDTRKAQESEIETYGADKSRMRFSKKIIVCPELDAINKHLQDTTAQISRWSLPSFFKRGIYVVALKSDTITTIDTYLASRIAGLAPLIEDLLVAYPREKRNAKQKLGPQFNEYDYIDMGRVFSEIVDGEEMIDYSWQEDIRKCFSISWKYINLDVPDILKKVNEDAFNLAKDRATKHLESVQEELVTALRARALDVIGHMAHILQTDERGKTKRFYDSSLVKLQDFYQVYKSLAEATGDEELIQIVERGRSISNGTSIDSLSKSLLKDDESTRGQFQKEFTRITEAIQGLQARSSIRKIDFDELD